ncbi:MAG TPA: Rid family detoxifying hydrolase, partial [Solirubrobacterales bacterium]|nr:Rid family detoxifying hydrolase [Solirubrobacterales bacterium]
AGAPYSQAITHAGLVYVSGQIGLDPKSGKLVEGGIEQQSEQALLNLAAILAAAGSSVDHVLRATVYLADLKDWQALNEVYRRHFADPAPARTAFQAAGLPAGAVVEVDAVAALADGSDPRRQP